MIIRKLPALLGLALVSTQANAADFWHARSNDGLTIIVDGDRTGTKTGDLVTAVFYMTGPSDVPMRAELQTEFNCANRQVRITKTTIYNVKLEPMPELQAPSTKQWKDGDDGETGKVLTDFACRPRGEWPRLGDKLTETTWQEAMTRQLLKSGNNQVPETGKKQQ